LQQANPDISGELSDMDARRREGGTVPQGPPLIVGIDVRRDHTGSSVEVSAGAGPAEDEHVSDPGQERTCHADQGQASASGGPGNGSQSDHDGMLAGMAFSPG
jgi:hypothetical protein